MKKQLTPEQLKKRRKANKIILSIFGVLVAIMLMAYFSEGSKRNETTYSTSGKPVAVAEKSVTTPGWESTEAFEQSVAIVDSLKGRFVKEVDEFKNVTWYKHKTFGKYYPNRKTLVVVVRNDGHYYTQSNYYGEDWLFHDHIQVKLGDQIVTSERLKSYDDRAVTENDGGVVWEVNHYTTGPNVAKSIFDYEGGEPIKIRFDGRQQVSDVVLSEKDRKAIVESVLFAEALEKTWNKIGGPKL